MKALIAAIALAALTVPLPAASSPAGDDPARQPEGETYQRLLQLAQSYSCSPRKTCKQMRSCGEAYWYLNNCGWGGRLDRDNDGVPCEIICDGG